MGQNERRICFAIRNNRHYAGADGLRDFDLLTLVSSLLHYGGRRRMEKIGVIGAGSWGTALAILLNENGNDVTLVVAPCRQRLRRFSRTREMFQAFRGFIFRRAVEMTADLAETGSVREKGACAGRAVQVQCARRRRNCVSMWRREL